MTLKELKDYFKKEFQWNNSISIGKIDNNKEKAICFYNSKYNLAYQGVIGGKKNKSTKIKPITILLRYTKNQNEAEEMATSIYEFFEERTFFIDKKRIFTQMVYEHPIDLGTDDNNVYEYSIEIYFYICRMEG
jgi:hypothetical protein